MDAVFEADDQIDALLPSSSNPASVMGLSLSNARNQSPVSTETTRESQGHQPYESRIIVTYKADVVRRTSVVAQTTTPVEKALS